MGSYSLDQGSNSWPLQWKHGVLTLRPPGKSQPKIFFMEPVTNYSKNSLSFPSPLFVLWSPWWDGWPSIRWASCDKMSVNILRMRRCQLFFPNRSQIWHFLWICPHFCLDSCTSHQLTASGFNGFFCFQVLPFLIYSPLLQSYNFKKQMYSHYSFS